jgi:hypothetical protein
VTGRWGPSEKIGAMLTANRAMAATRAQQLHNKLHLVHIMFKVWRGIREGVSVMDTEEAPPMHPRHRRAHTVATCLMHHRVNRFRKEGDCVELVSPHGRDVLRFIGGGAM